MNMAGLNRFWVFLVAVALAFGADAAFPQDYPNRPIRLIVPAAPAGAADTLSRLLGQKLGESWGTQVIVDNRVGAAGIVGMEAIAKAPNDGYTIGMGFAGTLAVNPSLYAKLPYDALRDYTPVALVAHSPLLLVVNPSVPANSVSELIALAKSKPGQLNYASNGSGSTQHLTVELLKSMTGINITHVPYKGSGQSNSDLVSGQVQMMMDNMVSLLPLARSGRVRALAVSTDRRSQAMPELPTLSEAGVPGYAAAGWYGVIAPAGTDPRIVAKLSAEIGRILRLKDVRERLLVLGSEPVGSTPEEFGAYIRAETVKWGKIVKDSGARAE
jgi:tripartite-type tricarboxylate transporter receptor subunit TctC